MNVNTFYVYELWNPIENKIFYVGKGTKYKNSYYRLSNHIKDSRYAKLGKIKMNHKFRTILKLIELGATPEMRIVFESADILSVNQKEIELIKFYGRKDIGTGVLTNHTDGGEGTLGYRHTPAHITMLKTDNKGGQATAKKIYSICPNTLNVVLYDSCNKAAIAVGGSRSNVYRAATKHINRLAYGYYWRLEPDYSTSEDFSALNLNRSPAITNGKLVYQYDTTGNLLRVWNSASEVCRFYGNNPTTLHRYLKNGKQWRGCIWKY